WARGVARRVALANLRKRSALPKLLDTEMLDAVGAEMDALGDQKDLENRKQILRRCLDQLSEFGRRLVQLRYFENRSYPEIAEVLKRNANSLYVAFNRIHGALLVCVRRQEGLS
ncbi:MAG: sigma factor-like helix-turn-helix DNA-binding protein, partial [Planctomycetota bacterium]